MSRHRDVRGRPARAAAAILALTLLCCLIFSAGAQAAGGSVMAWGKNTSGELGTGMTGPVLTPVEVGGLAGATQIADSGSHGLALLADGTVMAWGENFFGELGDGTTNNHLTPVPVGRLPGVVDVAAGESHSLALLANGTVMAWGRNERGELGDGTTAGPDCSGKCRTAPVQVPGLSGIVAISAAHDYSLALREDGVVLAWGSDEEGELGDGTGVQSGCRCVTRPTPVPGVSGAIAISAGTRGASALLADGTVRDWGRNVDGELGIGTTDVSLTSPCNCLGTVPVKGLTNARTIAGGGYHNLATLADGTAQAWGYNTSGELGTGMLSRTGCECIPSPVGVSGLMNPREVAAGIFHSLALLGDGTVMAWGDNFYGQLGIGSTSPSALAAPVAVHLGGASASAISASENDSFVIVGPSQALKVTFAGDGAGIVATQGLLCPPSCENRYPQGQVEILRPEGRGAGFAGFTGACTGTGLCQLRMDADQSVTATFGRPRGTAITAAAINRRKKTATFSFTAPGAITGYECELIRPRPKRKRKSHKRPKRLPPPRFSACSSPTTYKRLIPGKYTFKVRALDIIGADAVPAESRFKVKAKKQSSRSGRPSRRPLR